MNKSAAFMCAGALALGAGVFGLLGCDDAASTREASVAVPAPIAVPTPITITPVVVPVVEETEPGARCTLYNLQCLDVQGKEIDAALAALEKGAKAVGEGYDAKSSRFDAAAVAKHPFNVARWEGVIIAKRAGTIVVNATGESGYCVTINGQSVKGCGTRTLTVPLRKGVNPISIVRTMLRRDAFSIDFREAASTKPARPLRPSMLKHLVDDEEGGPANDVL